MSTIAIDPSNWKSASYEDHPVDTIEPMEKPDTPKDYKIALEFGSRLLNFIMSAKDAKRTCFEICFAIGKDVELGITMPQMAKRYGISKQAFSQGVAECRATLGLPSLQRSNASRERFRLTHKRWNGPRSAQDEHTDEAAGLTPEDGHGSHASDAVAA